MTFFNEELNLNQVNLHYGLIDLYCLKDTCTILYDPQSKMHEIMNKNNIFHSTIRATFDISQDNIKLETLQFLQNTLNEINNVIEKLKEDYDQYSKAQNEFLKKKEILSKDDLCDLDTIENKSFLKKDNFTIEITKDLIMYNVFVNFLNKINYNNSFLIFYNIRRTVNKDFNSKVKPFMAKVFNEMKEDIVILENEVERINKFVGNYGIFM